MTSFINDKVLFDTNLLVYRFEADYPDKRKKVRGKAACAASLDITSRDLQFPDYWLESVYILVVLALRHQREAVYE